jgi:hypothetical protein
MKYIITQKNIYEIVANNREDAVKMMKASTPSSSVSIEEMKETPDYSDLKNMMASTKNVTCDKVEKMLEKIKLLSPRINALYDLLKDAEKNGLRVSEYLHYPKRDYSFGMSGGALIYRTGDDWPKDAYIFIDCQGDVYRSDYARSYKDGNYTFCDTFKCGKGSPSNEEYNREKLNYLTTIYSKFDAFEEEVTGNIKLQLEYKMSHK